MKFTARVFPIAQLFSSVKCPKSLWALNGRSLKPWGRGSEVTGPTVPHAPPNQPGIRQKEGESPEIPQTVQLGLHSTTLLFALSTSTTQLLQSRAVPSQAKKLFQAQKLRTLPLPCFYIYECDEQCVSKFKL